jgi:hypothetical protein
MVINCEGKLDSDEMTIVVRSRPICLLLESLFIQAFEDPVVSLLQEIKIKRL